MATIGTLTVAFRAETSALESGVESVIASMAAVGNAVDSLRAKLSGLSSIAVSVDASQIAEVTKSVESLKSTVENSSATVSIDVASDGIDDLPTAVDSIEEMAEKASESEEEVSRLGEAIKQFAESAEDGFSRSSREAIEGAEAYSEARESVLTLAGAARVALSAISASAASASSAVGGLAAAFAAVTGSDRSLSRVADASITAAGRVYDSYETVRQTLVEVIPNAAAATRASLSTLVGTMGGFSTVVAAAGGSAAATAVAVASLGSAIVSGVASITTYAAVMAIAKFATAGLSEETQEYVLRAASVAGAIASAGVAARAGAAAYTLIGNAIWSSSSASEAFTKIFSGVASGLTASIGPALRVASAIGQVVTVLQLVNAASTGSVSSFAATAAASAAFAAGLGALQGSYAAVIAGTSALGGALGGAAAGLATFAAALPTTIALSVAAAVAFGRVEKALRHVGDNAEMLGNLSDRFGQPVQEIEKLKIAAEQSGVALNSVVRAQQIFSQNVSKIKIGNMGVAQTREASAAMKQLGISVEDLRSKKPEDLFIDVAREISKLPDATKKTQVAMDLFGRTGPALLPLLKNLEQVNEDIGRLGGTISDLDFERFSAVDQSFDRLTTASGAMADDLAIPFTRMQEAWNNASAEVIGGLAPLVGAIGEVIADLSTPFAVVVEVAGRVIGIFARIAAAVTKIVTAFLPVAATATLFELLGDAVNALLSPVESLVDTLEAFASTVEEFMRPTVEGFHAIGEAAAELLNILTSFLGLGDVFGSTTASLIALGVAYLAVTSSSQIFTAVMATSAGSAIASAATTAAAWVAAGAAIAASLIGAAVVAIGVYVASVIAATATTIASCAAMHVAWLFGLGPLGLLIAGIELLAVGVVALYALGGSIVDFFSSWGEGRKEIDGATASVEELAAAVEENQNTGIGKDAKALADVLAPSGGESSGTGEASFGDDGRVAEAEFGKARDAVTQFGMAFGVSEAEAQKWADALAVEAARVAKSLEGPSKEEIMSSISSARDEMADLSIRAAKFGQAGADAASKSTEEFNELQRQLGAGKINIDQFNEGAADIAENLSEGLDEIAKSSPEETLKRNLELFKQLDDAVKQAGKSIRDLTAVRDVDGKLLPASEEVKRRAAELESEYSDALEAIKKKQASGGFQKELDQRRAQAQADFESGNIDSAGFNAVMAELDSTNAQEQASIAVEEVQREFDRKKAKIQADISFADDIRKKLDDTFLSPVQKMEKELKKIAENPDLNPLEKGAAAVMVTKETRENLVGKDAQTQLQERRRDLTQARDSGIISGGLFEVEMQKAMDDLASAVGVTKTPFENFSSSIDNITKQFGFAGQPLEEVRRKLAGNADQLALFDRAVQDARDSLLESLGVEKSPQQVFEEQMKKIDEAVNSTDPSKKITEEEAAQARAVATRARDSSLGAGEDIGGQIAERRKKIEEAYGGGKDPAKLGVAMNNLEMDRRQAAGLDATPAQALKAGVDKINDAFGVTGKSMAEIQATLSPKEFAEYQEAVKKNSDAVKASLGVEKSGAEKIAESRQKLSKAVADGVITQKEADKAIKDQKDSLLSSLGISKSPAQEFEDAVAKIKENAAELSPEELAKGMKEAKDRLLSALGIDKTPVQQAAEGMKNLSEAFGKGEISLEEFARGMLKTRDTMLQSLGIPLDPVTQLAEKMYNLQEALGAGLITQEEFNRGQEEAKKSLLPGGEEESPVKKFQRDLETLQKANSAGLIDDQEFADRKMNLQAELQESLGPALDNLKPDRRGVEGADVRSKAGVDTFFRILRGNDNPSLKAQLEVARNTKILAEASKNPEAAPVLAMIGR